MENKNLGHLMLDLETMGNKSNAALISIGAVEFDINTGELGRQFYKRIDLQSAIDAGLIINGSTVYWWLQQNEKARMEVCKGGEDIMTVLYEFSVFLKSLGEVEVWGNGLRFDVGLLEDAYVKAHYHEMPWNFRKERDVRTLVAFAPEIKDNYPVIGIEHNPVDDCIHQIGYCHLIWKKMHKGFTAEDVLNKLKEFSTLEDAMIWFNWEMMR